MAAMPHCLILLQLAHARSADTTFGSDRSMIGVNVDGCYPQPVLLPQLGHV